MNINNQTLSTIQSLVGSQVTHENLRFIDCFVDSTLSMFMPVGGTCGYAVTPDHTHPAYMFVLSYDNETEVYIGGTKIKPYPNSLFCLSPEIKHHEVQNYLPPKYCAMFIDKDTFEMHLKAYGFNLPIMFNGLLKDIKNNRLELLVKDFINEAQNSHLSKDLVLGTLSTLIIHEVIRNVTDYDSHEAIVTDNLMINEVISHINIHFEEDIDIDTLSCLSNLSRGHFTKVFTDVMKVSPMVYLKTIRLQNAKKMLLANQISVTQIAQQCGFNSPSYFTKVFKETFNETPKEYLSRSK